MYPTEQEVSIIIPQSMQQIKIKVYKSKEIMKIRNPLLVIQYSKVPKGCLDIRLLKLSYFRKCLPNYSNCEFTFQIFGVLLYPSHEIV